MSIKVYLPKIYSNYLNVSCFETFNIFCEKIQKIERQKFNITHPSNLFCAIPDLTPPFSHIDQPARDINPFLKKMKPERKRKKTSNVWDYFIKGHVDGKVRRRCTVKNCTILFRILPSMTKLRGHLVDHEYLVDENQKLLTNDGELSSTLSIPKEERQHDFVDALCSWISDAGISFNTVENKAFKKLMSTCNSDINIPCRTTISRRIVEISKKYEIKVRNWLRTIPGKVNVTSDPWSFRVYRRYLTVTLHGIDENWNMQNILLDFRLFPSLHNGEATSLMLFDILSKCNFKTKLQAATIDNVSEMISAMTILTTLINKVPNTCFPVEFLHVRSISHVANLVTKEFLPLVHQKIKTIRNLLSSIR